MGVPSAVSVGATQALTGAITVPWGTHQTDDIGILIVETEGTSADLGTANGFALLFSAPATEIRNTDQSGQIHVFWCRATSNSMASPIIDDSGDHNIGKIIVVRGCPTTGNPFAGYGSYAQDAETNTVSCPSPIGMPYTDMMTLYALSGDIDTTGAEIFGTGAATNATLSNLTTHEDFSSGINNVGGQLAIVTGTSTVGGSAGTLTGTSSGGTKRKSCAFATIKSTTSVAITTGAPIIRSMTSPVRGATGGLSVPWALHDTNDIGLLLVETEGQGGGAAPTLSTANGFALLATSPAAEPAAGDQSCQATIFWCRASSSAQSAPTVADSGDHNLCRMLIVSNCVTTGDPWDVYGTGEKEPESTAVSISGITTTVLDTLIVYFIAGSLDSATSFLFGSGAPVNSSLAELFLRFDDASTMNNVGGQLASVTGYKNTAGSIGTLTGTSDASMLNAWVIVAMKSTTSAPPSSNGNFFHLIGV